MKQIIITVEETGEVKIDAVGFKGKSCEQVTQAMAAALGVKTSDKKKPEYYSSEGQKEQVSQ